MRYRLGRSDSPRTSRLARIRQSVSDWQSSQRRSLTDVELRTLLNPLYKPCIELQESSKNLVFFDRELKQVRAFPYPLTSKGFAVLPGGFNKYFQSRRLRFECYCGLKDDHPQFLEVKKGGPFGYFMSCQDCGLYMSIDKIYKTADLFKIYPPSDPYGEVKSATLSKEALAKRARQSRVLRRSQRRFSAPGYNNYRIQYLEDCARAKSSSPMAVEDLFKREESPGPVFVEERRGASQVASGSRVKLEDFDRNAPSGVSDKYSGIKFCHFCNNGMLEEDLEEHETDCWLLYSPSLASTRRTKMSID